MEINDNDLVNLECVNLHRQKHFLINPVLLQCGHFMCFNCVEEKKTTENTVKCGMCLKMRNIHFQSNPASFVINKQITSCLDKLFKRISESCNLSLTTLKNSFREEKERVETNFQDLKKDIDKRVESLKEEIDEICAQIFNDLAAQKEEYLKKLDDIYVQFPHFEEYFGNRQDIKLIDQTTESLELFQKNLDILKDLHDSLKTLDQARFTVNTDRRLDLESLGYFNYDKNDHLQISNRFVNKISIDIRPLDLCVLPGGQLLVADYLKKCLCLYDRHFRALKKVKKMNKINFKPFAVATNGIDRIYISDHESNRILVTDFNFNCLNCIESNELKHPYGICYSKGLLYVCSFYAKCIDVYKPDLTHDSSFKLDFAPWLKKKKKIQVIDKTACIRHFDEISISFYKLPEFTLKYRYNGHNGFICIAHNKFYEFCQPESMSYCYNSDGTIRCKEHISLPYDKVFEIYDPLIYFNNIFILGSNLSKEILTQ